MSFPPSGRFPIGTDGPRANKPQMSKYLGLVALKAIGTTERKTIGSWVSWA